MTRILPLLTWLRILLFGRPKPILTQTDHTGPAVVKTWEATK